MIFFESYEAMEPFLPFFDKLDDRNDDGKQQS
jgi:hypothetical protein